MHVTMSQAFETQSPIATDDQPDETKSHVVIQQDAEVTGQRALSSYNGRCGSIKPAMGGGGLLYFLLRQISNQLLLFTKIGDFLHARCKKSRPEVKNLRVD